MEFQDLVRKRYSARAYLSKPIEDEKLKLVMEAARVAPSSRNIQAWKFIVVREPDLRQQMMRAANDQAFVGDAPVIIAGVTLEPDHYMRCDIPAGVVDLSIALDHLTLQAAELGLGTCWIGSFYQDKVKKILQIPEKYKVVSLITLGYPADDPQPKSRKPLKDIVSYERFE
ncbi:nitroreductase family protein [bacterium]|nr:nitroreductase family protein [bacterium]